MAIESLSDGNVERRDTDRTEAFSDGIFAFAVTLLVLNLRDPVLQGTVTSGHLLDGLLGQWPSLFAFVTSFATILIMWVNHHNMFNHIQRVDTEFMFLNGMLLFFIVLTPFTTLIVSDHALLNDLDARTAAALYAADFLLLALVWNGLWRYGSKNNRLLAKEEPGEHVMSITKTYNMGPLFYMVAFVLAFLNPIVSVAAILLVALHFTVNATVGEHN